MTTKTDTATRHPAATARPVADRLCELMHPACRRMAVAGSLRRGEAEVGDIEIVAQPELAERENLFGDPIGYTSELDPVLARLVTDEILWRGDKDGDRLKTFYHPETGIKIDLFICLPPAQFGWLLLLRTGPKEFSRRAVTPRRHGGLMPSHLHSKDGAIRRADREIVPTPTELDVFDLFGIDFIEPGERG